MLLRLSIATKPLSSNTMKSWRTVVKSPAFAALAVMLTFSPLVLVQSAAAGDVQGDAYDCQELWVMRNQIYKDAGYCFTTPRAVTYFGIGGCQYTTEAGVPLSNMERSTIDAIRASEARQSCS
jgi:hypothetical protein